MTAEDSISKQVEKITNSEDTHRWLTWLDRTGLVAVAYLALSLLFYAPIVLGLRTFPDGDFTHHFLPFSLFQQSELLAGRLPVWNPYTYGGHPFLADIQAGVFYPISNLVLGLTLPLTAPSARLYFLQWEAILQIALAGFFTFLLVRDLTGNRWAAFLAGVIFAFSGYLTGYPPVQLAVLRTAIWLPLLFWLIWRAFGQPNSLRWWVGAGITYAVAFLAGHPQTFLFASYAMGAWMVFLWVAGLRDQEEERSRRAVSQAFGSIALLVIAAGLGAAQALPSIEFTRLSVRASVDYDFVSGGFPLQDTWQLLLPGVFTTYSPLYIGVVGLGLAAAATLLLLNKESRSAHATATSLRRPASSRAVILFFGIFALIALLLSYGGNAFLYPIFYRLAPGWNLFRGQERVAYLVAFALSVLAGFGAAAIPLASARLRHRFALVFGALVTIGVYAFGLIWQLTGRTAISPGAYLGIATVTMLLGIGFALMVWLDGWSSRRTLILGGLVLLNLFWANFATNMAPFGPARKVLLAPEMDAISVAVGEQGDSNLGQPGRTYNEFRVYEDYGMRQELEDVWGSSPLRLARYAPLFEAFPLDRAWDLLGVEHVLTWRRDLFEPSTLLGEFPQTKDTTYLHRLNDPNPRAWIALEHTIVDDATALAMLADHEIDLRQLALIADDMQNSTADLGNAEGFPADATPNIQMTQLAPGRLGVQVKDANAPLLVISENWMPGWQTSPPMPLVRTDLTLIGIVLPEPTVEFELVYRPDSVRFGLLISGITLLLVGLIVVVGWLRRRQPRRKPTNQPDVDRCSPPGPPRLGGTLGPSEALLSSVSPRIGGRGAEGWRDKSCAPGRYRNLRRPPRRKRQGYEATPHEWGWSLASPTASAWGGRRLMKIGVNNAMAYGSAPRPPILGEACPAKPGWLRVPPKVGGLGGPPYPLTYLCRSVVEKSTPGTRSTPFRIAFRFANAISACRDRRSEVTS